MISQPPVFMSFISIVSSVISIYLKYILICPKIEKIILVEIIKKEINLFENRNACRHHLKFNI